MWIVVRRDRARHRDIGYAEDFSGKLGDRPKYHIRNFIRYLHLGAPRVGRAQSRRVGGDT
jgi:hypothetical protein